MTALLAWSLSGPPGTAAGLGGWNEAASAVAEGYGGTSRSRSASRGKGHGTNLLRRCSDVGVVARAMTDGNTDHGCACDPVSMKRDSFAGAVHGLGKRARNVGTVNHGCAGMGEPRSGEGRRRRRV